MTDDADDRPPPEAGGLPKLSDTVKDIRALIAAHVRAVAEAASWKEAWFHQREIIGRVAWESPPDYARARAASKTEAEPATKTVDWRERLVHWECRPHCEARRPDDVFGALDRTTCIPCKRVLSSPKPLPLEHRLVGDLVEPAELVTRVRELHRMLDSIVAHFNRVTAIDREIDDVKGDGPIVVEGQVAWDALLNHRDALLFRVASFPRGIYRDHSRFGRTGHLHRVAMSAADLSALSLTTDITPLDEEPEFQRDRRQGYRGAAFARLFPQSSLGSAPSAEAVERLGRRFAKKVRRIDAVRDMAAHPYEINRDKFHVDFAAIARALAAWRTMLDDLLALANAEHRDSVEIVRAKPDDEIRDLLDLVVFGSANAMHEMASSVSDEPYHWQRRVTLYARLQELRTSLGARSINDPEVRQALPVKLLRA